jgi:hypothetical protein
MVQRGTIAIDEVADLVCIGLLESALPHNEGVNLSARYARRRLRPARLCGSSGGNSTIGNTLGGAYAAVDWEVL